MLTTARPSRTLYHPCLLEATDMRSNWENKTIGNQSDLTSYFCLIIGVFNVHHISASIFIAIAKKCIMFFGQQTLWTQNSFFRGFTKLWRIKAPKYLLDLDSAYDVIKLKHSFLHQRDNTAGFLWRDGREVGGMTSCFELNQNPISRELPSHIIFWSWGKLGSWEWEATLVFLWHYVLSGERGPQMTSSKNPRHAETHLSCEFWAAEGQEPAAACRYLYEGDTQS